MTLRKGKAKQILESSINSCLLAVEIYNKPRAQFRCEGYITLMNIAWTKLFHSYFQHTIGNKYYYKDKQGRYELINGERKAWDLSRCIRKHNKLSTAIVANLKFIIGLRNKIEHRYVDKHELDLSIFGELQTLLYNYENILIELFGESYQINENLVYSLQFSQMKMDSQNIANRKLLSKEMKDINNFIIKYRKTLPEEVFNSQEYSIKLVQIPRISNTNRNDLSIQFVKWDNLNEDDKVKYNKLNVLVKEKIIKKEIINVGRLKPSKVLEKVLDKCDIKINHVHHKYFYYVYSIRPVSFENLEPSDTNTEYCHYDEVHGDYLYNSNWVDFISRKLKKIPHIIEILKSKYNNKEKLPISRVRIRRVDSA